MDSSLRERFARLGPIRGISPVLSGSPAVIVLRLSAEPEHINSIAAIHALVRRGVKIRTAKRAVETMIERGEAVVSAPTVEPTGSASTAAPPRLMKLAKRKALPKRS